MRDKLAIASLVLSGSALLVVLFSPAPRAPSKAAGLPAERVSDLVQAEVNAVEKDGGELERIRKRVEALKTRLEEAGEGKGQEVARTIQEAVERVISGRRREFQQSLGIIRLYEKRETKRK